MLGPLVKLKVKEIAESLGYGNVRTSDGCLFKFRNRHSIKFTVITEEADSVKLEDAFFDKVPSFLWRYRLKDGYNAAETGLFYREIPEETLAFKSKNCITVLRCVSMGDDKEPLMVNGKVSRLNTNSLSVTWKYNSNLGWLVIIIILLKIT